MNKLLTTFVLFTLSTLISFGQIKGVKNLKWTDKPVQSPVYEKFKNEDAYLISERQTVTISMDSKGIYVYTSIKRKIKILTQKGVDNYARIILPKSAGRKLSLVDARTVKQNNQIVDLDVDEIKELKVADDDDIFDRKRYLIFSVPGVEAGDEIEVVAGYGGYGTELGLDIYLHSYLSAVTSEVILKYPKAVELDIRFYNNLAYPKQSETSTDMTYTWTSTDLPSLSNQIGSVPTLELPYISYAVKKIRWGPGYSPQEVVGNAWTSILDYSAKNYLMVRLNENSKDGKIDEFLQSLWINDSTKDIVSRIKTFHNFCNENLQVVNLPESESNMTPVSYLNSGKIDTENLFRIYHYVLNRVSDDYYFCMARNFYDGPIDFAFVAFQQINNILFSFKDEKGALHFITPKSEDEKYELGEVDADIQGTDYVAIKMKGRKEVTNPKLPFNLPSDNIRSRQSQVTCDLESGAAKLNVGETLQGVFSTNHRQFYQQYDKDSTLKKEFVKIMKSRIENATVDSISITSFETEFPFNFKIKYGLTIPDVVTKVDEKLFSISMENWFYHQVAKVDSVTRFMDYYFPNLGRDVFKYFLVFENDVQLVNAEKLRKYVKHQSCSYALEISQINPKTILIESTFLVSKINVKLPEIGKFAELYQKMEEADNEPVIIKIL